jgi:biopolymer transport protein ExbD
MKKKQSGIIIRLIDVVLILLFGFISISQLEKRSKVDLPVSDQTKLSTPDIENLIRISGYLVENDNKILKNFNALHLYLKKKKKYFNRDIRIKIYSEAQAPIKYTMLIADLCEQLTLKKSVVVKLKTRQSGLRIDS